MAPKQQRRARPKAPEGETRRQKFIRLGNARMTKAVKAIRQLGNLSGYTYEYTEGDVQKIENTLRSTIENVLKKFEPKANKEEKIELTFS